MSIGNSGYSSASIGREVKVSIGGNTAIEGGGGFYIESPAIKYPNPPHKHRDLIIAWANGADIQYRSKNDGEWITHTEPRWLDSFIYRIKPAKTPLELKIEKLEAKLAKLKGEL